MDQWPFSVVWWKRKKEKEDVVFVRARVGEEERGERITERGKGTNVVSLVFKGNLELPENVVGGLANDHGAHELPSDPSATTRSDSGFEDRDLQLRAFLSEGVSRGEASGTGAD